MTQTQAPTLTGQDIGEAEGALTALLEQALAGTGTTRNEYITLRVLAVRGPFTSPATFTNSSLRRGSSGSTRQLSKTCWPPWKQGRWSAEPLSTGVAQPS